MKHMTRIYLFLSSYITSFVNIFFVKISLCSQNSKYVLGFYNYDYENNFYVYNFRIFVLDIFFKFLLTLSI